MKKRHPTTQDLLDTLKEKFGSDTKAAAAIGVTQQSFSEWRTGKSYPAPDTQKKIAEISGLDPAYVNALILAASSEYPELRQIFQNMLRHFKNAAMLAAAMIGAASFGIPMLEAAQCVVRSDPRRRHPRGRSRTKNVTVKSLPAPAATTLPRRDWLGGLR